MWAVVRAIPPGRVTTYGAIARYLGSPQAARLVGYALRVSHAANPPVPAHRVVNHQGLLTGKHHFETPFAMAQRLRTEGVEVDQDQVQAFPKRFWDPCQALPLPDVFFSQT